MKKILKLFTLAIMLMLGTLMCTMSASAAEKGLRTENGYTYYYKSNGKKKTGWKTVKGNTYYFRTQKEGNAPKGSAATGLYKVNGKQYYFNSDGVMQTGWTKINGSTYYFKKNGSVGEKKGKMYTGLRTIGKNKYYFSKDGKLKTGFQKINGKTYYFKKTGKDGVKGRMKTGWRSAKAGKYYFNSSGVMQTGWTKIGSKRYYFDKSTGIMKTGWLELSKGKYYLGSDGARRKGWQTIGGNKYYFYKSGSGKVGVMAVNTTIDGYEIGADGIAHKIAADKSVLIVAGHGQGDPGATSTMHGTYYQESNYTRQFADLVYNALESSGKVNVTMYDQNYDWYQVNSGKASGPKITWSDYDFILEIHFNASAESSKDYTGNGSQKGMGIYVHSSSSSQTVDKKIISTVNSKTGFKIWGGGTGIFTDSSLLNPRLAEQNGIPYGLLETAFIDDYDDMSFYNKNKNSMASAVADGILSGLGL